MALGLKVRSVKTRLGALAGLIFVGIILLSAWSTFQLKGQLVEAEKEKSKNLVEAATDAAQSIYQRAQKGELDEATAQTLAKNFIRGMHYAGREYFFIYDEKGTNVAHGSRPEREGKNFLSV